MSKDVSKFKPLSSKELVEILGLTIKKDEANKLITFLCHLSAFTESSQFNISFNAPSSAGKSYLPLEIAQLFPKEDVIDIGYCSPTAFFHDVGKYSESEGGYVVDLSRKILIFLDQPHTLLLQHLRPMLSHDKKEINLKITDKSQKHGLRTKNISLIGYPAVIFCTTGLKLDEQETTRLILLSPDTDQEKIREGVREKIKKDSNVGAYRQWLNDNPKRKLLQERILAIKQANISEVRIAKPEKIEEGFLTENKVLRPRHQRDIGHLISLVKTFALLNLWFRDRENSTIVANEQDIAEAFKLWDIISESQELGLPPYVHRFYKEIIVPACLEKNIARGRKFEGALDEVGLNRQEIRKKHYQVYGRPIEDCTLRQQILPMLEVAGLIRQEQDQFDKRRVLVYPTSPLTISDSDNQVNLEQDNANLTENNSEQIGG